MLRIKGPNYISILYSAKPRTISSRVVPKYVITVFWALTDRVVGLIIWDYKVIGMDYGCMG